MVVVFVLMMLKSFAFFSMIKTRGRTMEARGWFRVIVILMAATLYVLCSPERNGRAPLKTNTPSASPGYVLFTPLLSHTTYLLNMQGLVVHTWKSKYPPGVAVYLQKNGNLFRCGRQPHTKTFREGGKGGRIQEFTWQGKLVWDFVFASNARLAHHDIEPMTNGNILVIAWERKSRKQAVNAGRNPIHVRGKGLWPDCVFEIEPVRPNGGRIVWEWHLWDHLIQDINPKLPNYGKISEYPERININGNRRPESVSDAQLKRMKALGYLGVGVRQSDLHPDFSHINAIDYNPELDQIALCVATFNEIWIIDHSTTTADAAGHTGGRWGKGGDLLFRWGNPAAYGRGGRRDQQLFAQHDVRWISRDLPGAGDLMIFNNGDGRPGRSFSSVIEITPLMTSESRYVIGANGRFQPERPTWEYTAPDKHSFYADFISGAHRLPNGHTFICDGPTGRFFEVTQSGKIVWEYMNPFSGNAPNPSGDPPFSVFRATHIPPDYPGLANRSLQPLDPQPPKTDRSNR